jgi:hypothetical protein
MHLKPERLAAGVQEDMVDALVKMWRDGQEGPLALTRENIKGILMVCVVPTFKLQIFDN